jgi:hypothetical protein
MSATAQLDNFGGFMQNQMMSGMPVVPIYQGNLTIVGNKTGMTNSCCYCLTMIFAAFLIFPFCFMCCMWWKKLVYPKYEMNVETYRAIARFVAASGITNLTLTIVDNCFNAEKARILYEALASSRITGFTFLNKALACNYD